MLIKIGAMEDGAATYPLQPDSNQPCNIFTGILAGGTHLLDFYIGCHSAFPDT